jgi:hypothetical protein
LRCDHLGQLCLRIRRGGRDLFRDATVVIEFDFGLDPAVGIHRNLVPVEFEEGDLLGVLEDCRYCRIGHSAQLLLGADVRGKREAASILEVRHAEIPDHPRDVDLRLRIGHHGRALLSRGDRRSIRGGQHRYAPHQVRIAVGTARREVAVVRSGSEQQHRLASLCIDRLRHPQIGHEERTRFSRRGGRVAGAGGYAFDPEFDRRGRHTGFLRLGGVERGGWTQQQDDDDERSTSH